MTQKLHKISIIVPVYNADEFLPQCINSLLVQTYNDIEILCVNDGSNDDSLSVLQKFAAQDSRVKVFTQQNSGPAKARNFGLAHATGEYLMFCDADDWYEPTMCREMLEAIIENDVDFAMCDCEIEMFDISHARSQGDIEYHQLKIFGLFELKDNNKNAISVLLWNKIFRLSLIKKYHISFPDGFESDDNAFIYQYLCIAQDTFGINQKLYHYRLLKDSVMGRICSRKNISRLFDVVDIFKFTLSFMIKHNFKNQNLWILDALNNQIGWALSYFSKAEKMDFLQKINASVLPFFTAKELLNYRLLTLCRQKKYSLAVELNSKIKRISFLGITLFKIKNENNFVHYYLLGIKIYSKSLGF